MTTQNTLLKLHEMRMAGMAQEFEDQLRNPQFESLTFEERFGILIDTEYHRRTNNKLQRLMQSARFRYPSACIEDIEYYPDRKLDKAQILRLASGEYIQNKRNIIIKGASGNGKSYLACAFGISACRQSYKVMYVRLPELLDELAVARGEGLFKKVMKAYKKVDLLILDEWLLMPLTESQSRDLLEIVEARHQTSFTIYCSQFDTPGWHEKIWEEPLADAIMDRIIHDSYNILIDGNQSMRERHGLNNH